MLLLRIKARTYAVTLAAAASGGYVTLQGLGNQSEAVALVSRWATAGFSLVSALCLTGLVFRLSHDIFGEDARETRASRKDPRLKALEAGRAVISKVLVESPRIDDEAYRKTVASLVQTCGQAEVESALEAVRRTDDEDLRVRLRKVETEFLKRGLLHRVSPRPPREA